MRFLIALLTMSLLVLTCAARAGDTGVVGGRYDGGMLIGFDPTTQIASGYFSAATGRGQFQCIFYMYGKFQGSKAPISSYFPLTPNRVIRGQLTLEAANRFRVRLQDDHGGCWNVMHFADEDQPANFTLEAAYPWIFIAVVKRDKAYFFNIPGSEIHRKGYVIMGDGVGVRATKPGWLLVDYVGGAAPVSGWIKQSDVFPAK